MKPAITDRLSWPHSAFQSVHIKISDRYHITKHYYKMPAKHRQLAALRRRTDGERLTSEKLIGWNLPPVGAVP